MILWSARQIWSFQFNVFSFPPLALSSFCASLLFGTWQVNATSGYEPKNRSPMEWPKLGILVQMSVQLRNCFTDSIDVKLGKGALFQEFKGTATRLLPPQSVGREKTLTLQARLAVYSDS